jgi:hypothetical protein
VPARLRPGGTPRARPELLPAGRGARAAGLRPRGAEWPLAPRGALVARGPVIAEWPLVPRRAVVAEGTIPPERLAVAPGPFVAEGALAPRRTGVTAWPAVAEPPVPAEVALTAVLVVPAAVIAVPAATVPVIARCPVTATGLAARAG